MVLSICQLWRRSRLVTRYTLYNVNICLYYVSHTLGDITAVDLVLPPPFSSNTWGNYLVLKKSHFWQFDEGWICGCPDPGDRKLIQYQLVHFGRSEPIDILWAGSLFKFYLELIARHFIGKVIIDNGRQALMYGRAYFFFQVQFYEQSPLKDCSVRHYLWFLILQQLITCRLHSRSLNCQAVFGPALDWSCAFSCTTTCSVWVWSFTMFSFIFVIQ